MWFAAWASINDRRIGDRATRPIPSRISRTTGSRSETGGGGGSGRRIVIRRIADATYEAASMAIVIGAVRTWTRKPLIPKPVNSAAAALPEIALLAATRRSRGTIVGR